MPISSLETNNRKGLILAGGNGTRLYPVTHSVSKQMLPVFDKPMIYYALSVLMLCKIREIAVITSKEYLRQFRKLLGDGSQWGLELSYIVQPSPDGIGQAYLVAEEFLNGSCSALILGDNIFYGHELTKILKKADNKKRGGTIFGYRVSDPNRYGVVEFDQSNKVKSLEEKPKNPKSNYAITGLYFLDNRASDFARSILPSGRGELEITDLLNFYVETDELKLEKMGRGYAWLDTGTHESLLDAGNFVKTLQKRQGFLISSPDEIAYRNKWITKKNLLSRLSSLGNNEYRNYLQAL